MMKYENTISTANALCLVESVKKLAIIDNDKSLPHTELLFDYEGRVSEKVLIDLWKYVDRHSLFENHALMIGQAVNTSSKDILTSLLCQCKNLNDALDNFIEHIDWMNPSENWKVKKEGNHVTLIYSIDKDKGYPDSTLIKSMSELVAWCRVFTQGRVQIISTHIDIEEPLNIEPFYVAFCKNIQFSSSKNIIKFKSDFFDKEQKNYSPFLKGLLKKEIQNKKKSYINYKKKRDQINKKNVSFLIADLLPKKRANIEFICNHLSVSRQTLFRILKKEDTTFKELLNETRKKNSIELLSNQELKISEISSLLGYTDISSFYTAFNNWFGMSVSDYRKTL